MSLSGAQMVHLNLTELSHATALCAEADWIMTGGEVNLCLLEFLRGHQQRGLYSLSLSLARVIVYWLARAVIRVVDVLQ